MVRPDKPPSGKCPHPDREACNLVCKYNHFENDELVIDSWELKCLDCGQRETIAFRSDDEDLAEDAAPTVCPFCAQGDLPTGQNPCQRGDSGTSP